MLKCKIRETGAFNRVKKTKLQVMVAQIIIVVWGVKTERSGGKDTRTKLKQRSSLDNMGTSKTHVLRLGPQLTTLWMDAGAFKKQRLVKGIVSLGLCP